MRKTACRAGWLALCAAITLTAYRMRALLLGRGFEPAEYDHHFAAAAAARFRDLPAEVADQFQPILEYLLRKAVWIPWFGNSEMSMRIPSLIYSCATVLLCAFAARALVRERFKNEWLGAAGGATLAVWLAFNELNQVTGTQARHYGFITLCSIAWFATWSRGDRVSRRLHLLTSFCFMNSHFFALPLVGIGFAFDVVSRLRKRDVRDAVMIAAQFAVLAAITRLLNAPALESLANRPPDPQHAPLTQAFGQGIELYARFFDLNGFYGGWMLGLALIALLTLLAWRQGRRHELRAVFLIAVFLPAFLVYLRMRSGYAFGDRYFTPFSALAFWLVLELWMAGVVLARRIGPSALAAYAIAGVAFVSAGQKNSPPIAAIWAPKPPLHSNFSPYYLAYQEIADRRLPTVLYFDDCYTDETPAFYFKLVLRPPYATELHDSRTCRISEADTTKAARRFLKVHRESLWVFDSRQRDCADQPALRKLGNGARVERIHSSSLCMWTLENPASLAVVTEAARAVGLETSEHFLQP